MYKMVAFLSVFIRENILPSAFETIIKDTFLLNVFDYVISPLILGTLAYTMCGIFYREKSCPVIGSLLFLFFYMFNIKIIRFIGSLVNDIYLFFIIFLLIYTFIYLLMVKLRDLSENNRRLFY